MNELLPGSADIATRRWDFGRGLRGYRWEARRPRASLLLQHGFCEYAERYVSQYSGLVPKLVHAGITVHAFDLRGHGRSPGARAVVDARGAVEDHLAARRALADEPGPLFLFGHSLGGLVTAASMARDPAGVRGVILSSPLLVAHASPVMRLVAALLGRLAPRSIVLRSDPKQLSRIPEAAEIVQADPMFCKPGGVPARLAASALATMADAWERYPGWTTPVLVFHGTADRVTDPAGSQRFVETIAATDKTLRLFAGAYHEILNDLDREDALRLVLEWLEARIDGRT